MPTILGIDAAWTVGEPSGVALVRIQGSDHQCLAVAPSYQAFVGLAEGGSVDWHRAHKGDHADVPQLLRAARSIAREPVDLVAVDMPLARVPIVGRRVADNEISSEFGERWCSAHTPSVQRPGPVGLSLSKAFETAGYVLATSTVQPDGRSLIEVYPHAALLSLLRRDRRVPYKVSKSGKYWPGQPVNVRVQALLGEFRNIAQSLGSYFGDLRLPLPTSVSRLSELKRYEDSLDALVCAWVGGEYLARRTVGLGDGTAAIWCPTDVVLGNRRQANRRLQPAAAGAIMSRRG